MSRPCPYGGHAYCMENNPECRSRHPERCRNDHPGATLCQFCGGDLPGPNFTEWDHSVRNRMIALSRKLQ